MRTRKECDSLALVENISYFIHIFDWPKCHLQRGHGSKHNTWLRKGYFLGLILRWKPVSLVNTISIWSNISGTLGGKNADIKLQQKGNKLLISKTHSIRWTQIRICNGKSTRHAVKIHSPHKPSLNAVFLISPTSTANCKYPWGRSKEVNQLPWHTTCNALSMHSKGTAFLMIIELGFL